MIKDHLKHFFEKATLNQMNGVICGYHIEEIENEPIQKAKLFRQVNG
jgi:hypothetical protein